MDSIIKIVPILKVITLASVFFVWFIRYENIVKEFVKFGYSSKLRDFVGILKISSVILIQSENAFHVQVGSVILSLLMLSAFVTHLRIKNPLMELVPSLTLLVFSILFYTVV